MFQANLVSVVSSYPLSKLIPESVKNEDGESLIDYISEDQVFTWGGYSDISLVKPKVFRDALSSLIDAGEFNRVSPEIESILSAMETLILRDIHISLGE